MKTKLIITGLALMALTTIANAQIRETGQRKLDGTGRGPAYVDANKNGVCDNFENGTPGGMRGNRSAEFRGQGRGQRPGQGQKGIRPGRGARNNFIDENNNGVCDYFEKPAK